MIYCIQFSGNTNSVFLSQEQGAEATLLKCMFRGLY